MTDEDSEFVTLAKIRFEVSAEELRDGVACGWHIAPENRLAADIDKWLEAEIAAGEGTPDFWNELNTSDRLAVYLVRQGWSKAEELNTTLPPPGSTVVLQSNAKRYHGGPATVLRHEERKGRWGLVVALAGREIWVAPGELESADG